MASNIILENKIGNPRTLKKIRNQNEESIDRCGVGSDWDPIFSILYMLDVFCVATELVVQLGGQFMDRRFIRHSHLFQYILKLNYVPSLDVSWNQSP